MWTLYGSPNENGQLPPRIRSPLEKDVPRMYDIPKPDAPAWPGPYKGGVTQSLINRFLECPFRFYLYAVLGLEDIQPDNENLIWGDTFHRALEEVISMPKLIAEFNEDDFAHVDNVVHNHLSEKWPSAPTSYEHTICQMYRLYNDSYKTEGSWKSELEIHEKYTTATGREVLIRGKIDGICEHSIVEHKCKGKIDPQLSRIETPVDLQTLLYCRMSGRTSIIYDLIRIPEAQFFQPQRRTGQSWSNWSNMLFNTYTGSSQDYPISRRKHLWLDQYRTFHHPEDLDWKCRYLVDPLIDSLCRWWDRVTDPSFDPNDYTKYDEVFYIKPVRTFDPSRTEKFKCNYHGYLCGDISLDELRPANFYAELSNEEKDV